MSNTLRTALRRKAVAVLTAPLLLGSGAAAAPLSRAEKTDVVYYVEKYYSMRRIPTR